MDKLNEILERYKDTQDELIPVLQEAQDALGYLTKEILICIAKRFKISLSQIYSVVTFYPNFFLTPHGKYTIRLCRGSACQVQGAKKIISTVENTICLKQGETSSDLKWTFETVSCMGACALSPVMMINKDCFGKMTPKKATAILHQYNGKD